MTKYFTRPNVLTGENRIFKEVSSQLIISQLPDLEQIEAIAENGIIAGQKVSLSWDGTWKSQTSSFHSGKNDKEDIILNSNVGKILLHDAFWTSHEGLGATEGTCINIKYEANPLPQDAKILYRTIIPIDKKVNVLFPEWIKDSNGSQSSLWLPIKWNDKQIDLFYLKEPSWLIIELCIEGLTYQEYSKIHGGFRQFCCYVLGLDASGKSCDVLLSEDESTIYEAYWYSGRNLEASIYHPIPSLWGEWAQAQRIGLPIPQNMKFRDSEVMSRCWQNYLDHPELFIPIEYVLHFPSAPVEMRGALLSVALESLSKVVLR